MKASRNAEVSTFLLSTISTFTYQTLGIFGIKLFYRALLTQLKKPFGNPSNTAKVIHKTIWLNPHMPINCLVHAPMAIVSIACEPITALFPTM